jgi:NAD(P)-dependent dehydrogenase (short-subunit alcohol dehydrogenase family)
MPTGSLSVIVTGAAQGIGRAMSLGLARSGVRVVMVDVAEAALTEAAAAAKAAGGQVLPIAANITREGEVQTVIGRARAEFGGVHALVNNAAIGRATIRPDFMTTPIKLWEITPDQWRRIVDVNVNGFFLMTRAVVPLLIDAGWGRIVSVTTSLDTMLRGGSATYGGSKAAVEAYTATLAEDLNGTGVTANILVPGGPVNTAMIPSTWKVERTSLIQPDIMVPPLAWLLSRLSDGVTGRRFIATRWKSTGDQSQAAQLAGAPAGWPQLGEQALFPQTSTSSR